MLPWNYGFHWSAGSVVFLGAFYAVLTAVVTTLFSAVRRSRYVLAGRSVGEIRWRSEFHDLLARDRACRHALTGELAGRVCPDAFDCGRCETHARLLALPPQTMPAEEDQAFLGLDFPLDRLYHRGHTWVHPEPDGTVTVGLDDLGRRVLGLPDAVELPPLGARLHANQPAWRTHKRNARVRILSPVDGEVLETGGPDRPWYLRVKLAGSAADLRHLLRPPELRPRLLHEIERLQLALSAEGAPALADGGVLVSDLAASCPEADWDSACGAVFLEP